MGEARRQTGLDRAWEDPGCAAHVLPEAEGW
jgi:hypothetical protein